jgi:hypothetical protein
MTTRTSLKARRMGVNDYLTLANNGYIEVYAGVRPATVEDPTTGSVLLARGQMGAPAFDPAQDSGTDVIAAARTIQDEPSIRATGDATWFRIYEPDGETGVFDGDAGTDPGTCEMVFNNAHLVQGARCVFPSCTYVVPMDA